jgi:hypothetical protein
MKLFFKAQRLERHAQAAFKPSLEIGNVGAFAQSRRFRRDAFAK